MKIYGYADAWSVRQGEPIAFKVNSEVGEYRADVVRLLQADDRPQGPGYRETEIEASCNGEYPGRIQKLRPRFVSSRRGCTGSGGERRPDDHRLDLRDDAGGWRARTGEQGGRRGGAGLQLVRRYKRAKSHCVSPGARPRGRGAIGRRAAATALELRRGELGRGERRAAPGSGDVGRALAPLGAGIGAAKCRERSLVRRRPGPTY